MTTSELGPEADNKCDNCGEQLLGDYCWVCGQKDTHYNRSVFKVIGDFFKEMFDVDSRVFSTLSSLFLRPGTLSVQFRDNKRASFVRPIRLYLFSSLVFFFLVAVITQNMNLQINAKTGENETNTSLAEDGSVESAEPTDEEVDQCLTRLNELVSRSTFESARRVLEKKIVDLDHDPWRERILARVERLQHGPRINPRLNELVMFTGDNEIDILTREITSAERRHGMMKVLHVVFADDSELLDQGTEIVMSNASAPHIRQAQDLLWTFYEDHHDNDFKSLSEGAQALLTIDLKVTANLPVLVEEMVENLPLMMFVLLPIFVSLLALLSLGKGIRVVYQLIFAMHLHAFTFITLTLNILIATLIGKISTLFAVIFILVVSLFIVGHTYLAFKKFYGSGHFVSLLKFVILTTVYVGLLTVSLISMMFYFYFARQF